MSLWKTLGFTYGNKVYIAEQLAFDTHQHLNSNTEEFNSDCIFNYAYGSTTRMVVFSNYWVRMVKLFKKKQILQLMN